MINDNMLNRTEFIEWLQENGLYDPMCSAVSMQLMNDVYWTLKKENEK